MPSYSRSLTKILPLLGMVMVANAVQAQPQTTSSSSGMDSSQKKQDLFAMSLEDVLDIDVSTASKLKVKGKKSPGNLIVITQEQIRRYGYRTVGDALERVPGFINSKLGAFTFIGYRGLSPLDVTANPRILVMVDGVRYNDWQFDQASLNERFPLDIESIDRIEVLKGAASATWGTNALFAVVNVISKSADSARAKQVLMERGANNRNKFYSSWAGTIDGGLKYFTSASITDEDNDISAYYPAFDEPQTDNGIARDPYHQRGHRFNTKLSYGDLYANIAYGNTDHSLGTSVDFLYGDGGTVDYRDIPVRGEVGYKKDLSESIGGEVVARSFYTFDRSTAFNRFPIPDEPNLIAHQHNRTTTQAAGGEIRYTRNLSDQVQAVTGVELTRIFDSRFRQNNSEFSERELTFSEDNRVSSFRTMASYFGDLVYSPWEELSLFVGGRADKFTDLETVFGPRASIVVNPVESTTLRLVYSRGLRNPSLGEMAAPGDNVAKVEHETLDYYEAYAEHRVADWLTVASSVFLSELNDTVGFVAFEDGSQTYGNTAGLRSRGIEFDVRAQLASDLETYGIVTYAEGRDKTLDRSISAIPKTLARLGASYGDKRDSFFAPRSLWDTN